MGTNRLPVLVGMATAIWRFQWSKAIPWRLCLRLLPAFFDQRRGSGPGAVDAQTAALVT
jgi:hypothetical protein